MTKREKIDLLEIQITLKKALKADPLNLYIKVALNILELCILKKGEKS